TLSRLSPRRQAHKNGRRLMRGFCFMRRCVMRCLRMMRVAGNTKKRGWRPCERASPGWRLVRRDVEDDGGGVMSSTERTPVADVCRHEIRRPVTLRHAELDDHVPTRADIVGQTARG